MQLRSRFTGHEAEALRGALGPRLRLPQRSGASPLLQAELARGTPAAPCSGGRVRARPGPKMAPPRSPQRAPSGAPGAVLPPGDRYLRLRARARARSGAGCLPARSGGAVPPVPASLQPAASLAHAPLEPVTRRLPPSFPPPSCPGLGGRQRRGPGWL